MRLVHVFLAACALACVAAAPSRAANSLSVTQYGVAATALPWGVALQEGFLKESGLDIDGIVSSTGGGTSVRNMMASGVPFGEVATSAGIAAVQAGLDISFVYSANNNPGGLLWMTLPNSPIKKMADLKGQKLGFSNPRSTTEMFLHLVLHKAGLDDQVTLISTGGIPAGWTMLDQGFLAAVPVDDPAFMPKDKYRILFSVRDFVPVITWTVGITTKAYAKAHPEVVRGLILARRKAVDDMASHPEAAAKIFARDWQVDESTALELLRRLMSIDYFSRGDFNLPGLQSMMEGMKLAGALEKPVDVVALIDKSFLPEDLR